jgi:multidrug efflux pump
MNRFTDKFVCRPVLASVISLFFVVLGLRAYLDLEVRQYPAMTNTLITVNTSYPGANAQLMEGFITKLMEASVAGAQGVDYMVSSSYMGTSEIDVYIKTNFDPNVAFTDVNALAQSQVDLLPEGSQLPTVTKKTGSSTATMYIGFRGKNITSAAISDYILRVIEPKLFTVSGVATVQVMGGSWFSMRIWLNTQKMNAYHVSMEDIQTALSENDVQSAAGTMKGDYVQMDIQAKTDTTNAKEFSNIVVSNSGNTLVRLKDVAKVDLGKESYDSVVIADKKPIVIVAVYPQPDANTLDISNGINGLMPDIKAELPSSISIIPIYDSSMFVVAAINDVLDALWEAVLIVMVVILLFLGSLRSILIPIITIPLSLIGTMFIMQCLGYTINLMTLLAFVIAVSLVVDDAIVVMENIYRHLEEGRNAFDAAIIGAREIAYPVVVMTFTLIVVYIPIGMMTGITGSLFKEFAFTLAATVLVSGILALTLSPMMCSKILNQKVMKQKTVVFVDKLFSNFRMVYQKALSYVMNFKYIMVILGFFIMANCVYFFMHSQSELAPQEDQGVVFTFGFAPQYATIDYDMAFVDKMGDQMDSIPQRQTSMVAAGMGQVSDIIGVEVLIPWDKRPNVSATQVQDLLQQKFSSNAGLMLAAAQPPSLPTGGKGFPISFEVVSQKTAAEIYPYAIQLMLAAQKSGLFTVMQPSVFMSRPQLVLDIDRSKAGLLGITMSDIRTVLSTAMSGNYVNYFNLQTKGYRVVPQVQRRFRLTPELIGQMRIKTGDGTLIPLSTIVHFSQQVIPNVYNRFQQQNSVELTGTMAPGHSMGEGLQFLIAKSKEIFPKGIGYDTSGQTRQFLQEGNTLVIAFGLAIIIIFLVLSAQFESFRDPVIILISVPMSVFGAMLPIYFGASTMNIYTEVGMLTLIGLISKHGILIVQFANDLRAEGKDRLEAIVEAAGIRLRPVLMTTAAMVFGMLPLVFSSGAGAVANHDIGLVISLGMLIGTCFTLFILPAFYLLLSGDHKPEPEVPDDAPIEK